MSNIIQRLKVLSLFILAIFLFQSCAKDEFITEPVVTEIDSETITEKPFELYLTDCPFDADEVNVEILSVVLEDADGTTEALFTNAGVYNLLDFTDGIDTLLASGMISIDNIKRIYIELGSQNTVLVDGVTFPLLLDESNSIVEIGVDLEQIEDLAFLVDFFACTSIIETAEGYILNPIIKFKGEREEAIELAVDIIEAFEECYQIVYPIQLLDNNNTTLTAASRELLIDILIDSEIKEVLFPINLLDPNGNAVQLNSADDVSLLQDCDLIVVEEEDEELGEFEALLDQLEECYDIVYPLSLLDADNETLEATNAAELLEIFENNEIENAVFPLQLIDTNGATININQVLDFALLNLDC